MNMLKGQSLTCCTMLWNNASPNFVVHITRASKHSKILGLLKMCVEHETVYFHIFFLSNKINQKHQITLSPCQLTDPHVYIFSRNLNVDPDVLSHQRPVRQPLGLK